MTKYFVDWARSKAVMVVDESGNVREMTAKEMITEGDKPAFSEGDEIYLETGFSAKVMYRLLDGGCVVHRVPGRKIKELRSGKEKTDIDDAFLIKQAYEEYPEWFSVVEKPSGSERKLRRLYTMYRQVTRDIVRFKNIAQGHEWEFDIKGDVAYGDAIKNLETLKKDVFKQMKPFVKEELRRFRKLKGIKGIGPMLLAQLLAIAHPRNFETLSKYLAYCGCKASTFYKEFDPETGKGNGRGKHNWEAKVIGYLMAKCVLRAKDPCLEKWYYGIKERFHEEHPEWSDGICHGKAMNRLRTYIMKEIYDCLKDMGAWPTVDEVFGGS